MAFDLDEPSDAYKMSIARHYGWRMETRDGPLPHDHLVLVGWVRTWKMAYLAPFHSRIVRYTCVSNRIDLCCLSDHTHMALTPVTVVLFHTILNNDN